MNYVSPKSDQFTEKKNEEVLKQAEFLKTQARVKDLESQIEALTKRHKHEKIELEKELCAARQEKQVSG